MQGNNVEVEYTLTEDEYVKANRLFTKPTKKSFLIYVAVTTISIIVALVSDILLIQLIVIGGLIGGSLGHVIVRYLYAPWVTRKQYRSYKAIQEPVSVSKQSDGIYFKSDVGEAKIEWSRINKWRENDIFVLIYQAPQVYHILPKRKGSEIAAIRKELMVNIGNAT